MKSQRDVYHEMFEYCEESPSFLLWKKRPADHFNTARGHTVFNRQFAGKPAGSRIKNTSSVKGDYFYWYITKPNTLTRKLCPDLGVHRIIYRMFVGEIPPTMEIDHIDNDTENNRISNLRLATKNQNQHNARAHQTKHLKGAYPLKTGGWTSFIAKDKVRTYLGFFATEQQAHQAYCDASEKLHKTFSRKI